jgi:hypothetical protein
MNATQRIALMLKMMADGKVKARAKMRERW